ncbi:MAG: valine--tRNA ligase [archaeon]
MDKNKFDFHEIEEKWRNFWEKEKIYSFDSKNKKKVYSIDTPPPTVSGKMHIGHACSYSQQDFIARFHRMYDGNVFYPFGTDDNGLPTERLVEKLKNVKSKNMIRAEFIALCLKTLKEITPDFIQDWKNLGVSCDYYAYYSTIDDNSRKLSQKSFLDFYKKGLIYKKDFPSLWCPECQTAVAQAELEDKELPSLFSTLKFSCQGKPLLIATTRPELLGACVAVFVNPQDKRYKNLIGKKASVPLFNYDVPIIADDSAQLDKGTGVLMVCSYGDKYDAEAINKYKLNPKIVINLDGTLNLKEYKGMKIKDARKKILQDLKEADLITEQKQISHNVNTHDKCGTEIEFLPTEQWFIKILNQKKKLTENGRKIKWHPEFMFKRYENWVKGLEWDWNISRDRHFGIPIPAWECKKCNEVILASEKELPVDPLQLKKKCPKCGGYAKPEEKVLDTWATSSISPQIAYGLSSGKVNLPFSLRPQAHDIIRTWLFYTIVKSYYHENKIPWENAMISGFVTLSGEKMSKSKGNVISPQEIIEKYGADALRFWAAGSKLGEDLDYQEKDLETGKKFTNKLMNASKFVFMNLGDYKNQKPKTLEKTDELFLLKMNELIEIATSSFKEYEYSRAKLEAEKFFWQIFCDNYLEIIKDRIYNSKGDKKISAQYTLYHSLLCLLKLFAPITPFITEEIYQNYFFKKEKEKSIHISSWPEKFSVKGDKVVFDLMVGIISKVRQEKSKAKRALNAEIILHLPKKEQKTLQEVLKDLKSVTKSSEVLDGEFRVDFK